MNRITVAEYFELPESQYPMELVYGVVREPPAPRYGHQSVVTRLAALLDAHVRERGLGCVCGSPVDVVLDETAALVVQPDIIYVAAPAHCSRPRLGSPRPRRGGPVAAYSGARPHDKLRWYRRYGVRECWLADPAADAIEVRLLGRSRRWRAFAGERRIVSGAFPDWSVAASHVFDN